MCEAVSENDNHKTRRAGCDFVILYALLTVGSTEAVNSLMILVASSIVLLRGVKFAVVGEAVAWWMAPWICVAC
jgi:hypothetical protein